MTTDILLTVGQQHFQMRNDGPKEGNNAGLMVPIGNDLIDDHVVQDTFASTVEFRTL